MTEHLVRTVNRRHGTFGKILFHSERMVASFPKDTAAYEGLIQA
jgi:hypothetical protein